jgi:FtsP/CotA-like multicopper oxidase with cupredoxin domain
MPPEYGGTGSRGERIMKALKLRNHPGLWVALAWGLSLPATGAVFVQCPGDNNGDAVIDSLDPLHPNAKCMHLSGGDGFVKMADGYLQYIFGFADLTGIPPANAMSEGMLAANFPAPTIALKQGQEFYLTLTNAGMVNRPDLFDPHSVHFHGFPQAAPVFDGMPEGSIAINMGSSITYYYNLVEPGTFMYHCHVEATEHMQMGMLGNLYVSPMQNGTALPDPDGSGRIHTSFVYNDVDGSTGYDVEVPIQLGSFDPAFHDASMTVQPLPFADMKDKYAMMNGRGYPDTVNPAPLSPPVNPVTEPDPGKVSQKVSSVVTATSGQKVLLRLSNLSVTNFYTVTALGLPMKVVGTGAHILRGPDGTELYYDTSSVTLGGGEAADVIIDTAGVTPGTYFLYTTNLNYLSNNTEDYGGMMTEIVIN